MMRRMFATMVLAAACLAVAPTVDAAPRTIPMKSAKKAIKKYAKRDFYPATIRLVNCKRFERKRVRCGAVATYPSLSYCLAVYGANLRGRTIYVSKPYAVMCS